MIITSSANTRIKQIRKLRERKERLQSGLFLVEGLRIVAEAIQTGAPVVELVIAPELLVSEFGRDLAASQQAVGIPVLEVTSSVFASLSAKEGPQGIAAVIQQRWTSLDTIRPDSDADWVAIDAVQDPGNLGTILRTNDAVGGRGIVLLDHSTDPYDPGTVRASMGAVFSQRLIRTDLNAFTAWKRQTAIPLIGAAGSAAQDYHDYRYPAPCILLMGSERQGLTEKHLAICNAVVRIPMVGRSDSLNLAVAAAVILYEKFNQRRTLPQRVNP
jgi:TrmH family RNA methyltransferase